MDETRRKKPFLSASSLYFPSGRYGYTMCYYIERVMKKWGMILQILLFKVTTVARVKLTCDAIITIWCSESAWYFCMSPLLYPHPNSDDGRGIFFFGRFLGQFFSLPLSQSSLFWLLLQCQPYLSSFLIWKNAIDQLMCVCVHILFSDLPFYVCPLLREWKYIITHFWKKQKSAGLYDMVCIYLHTIYLMVSLRMVELLSKTNKVCTSSLK